MKKHIGLSGLLIVAILFTMCGQGTAYVLEGVFDTGYPIYYLTALVIIGTLLFAVAIILATILTKRKKLTEIQSMLYLSIGYMVGIPSVLWSFFVTAMWWG